MKKIELTPKQQINECVKIYKIMQPLIEKETKLFNALSANNMDFNYPINALDITTSMIITILEIDKRNKKYEEKYEELCDILIGDYNESIFYNVIAQLISVTIIIDFLKTREFEFEDEMLKSMKEAYLKPNPKIY